jgi:hypothetical protein
MKTTLFSFVIALLLTASGSAQAQTPAPTPAPLDIGITATLALGDVTSIDTQLRRLTLKTKDGEIVASLDDTTVYKKVKPGETSLKDAELATLAEIGVGDRVIAMGRVAADRKTVPARQVILMTKAAIEQKHEADRADWQRRGIVGRITALNAETKQVSLSMRAPAGERPISLLTSDKVVFRRYAPDSVKFSDAKTSSFAELRVGDQIRARGERSADGAQFTPDEIVSGSFRMVGGAITTINPASSEIVIANLQTGQPVTIVVNKDSVMRRIPPEMAAMIAQRRAQQAGGTPGAAAPTTNAQGAPTTAPPNGGPRGGRGGDFDEIIERLPPLTLAELKKGDVIAVSSTTGVDPGRVTAIKLVAGIEALMTRTSGPTSSGSQSPSLNLPGLDSIGGP